MPRPTDAGAPTPSRWPSPAGTSAHRSASPRSRSGSPASPTTRARSVYTFVICLVEDERPIGEVMLIDIDRVNGSAEVGIFIGEPDEWGKGYGTDAVRALVDFGFAELRLERDLAGGRDREPAGAALVREGRLHPGGDAPPRSLGGWPLHRRPRHVDPPRRVAEPPLLTERALNRALLARQLLLERAPLSIPEALSRLAGIQNQYAPNAYIRLWSCLAGFDRDDLTRAYEDASVVQGTLMRGTIHTVARDDYRLFLGAVARAQREWAGRATKAPANLEPSAALARVRAELAGGTDEAPGIDRAAARRASGGALLDRHRPRDPARPAVGHLGAAAGRPVRPRRRRHRSRRGGAGGRRAARARRALPGGLRAGIGRRRRDVPGDERLDGQGPA